MRKVQQGASMKIIQLSSLIIVTIFFVSCSSDKLLDKKIEKAIEDNPEIIFKAIEKNPEKFVQTFQLAVQMAKKNMAQNQLKREQEEIERAIESPYTPSITKNDIIRGNKDAPITIVEYSDFECGFCAKSYPTVQNLMKKYNNKIRFVYKHLPLSFHPNAMITSQYYEAIALQNKEKAHEFHDLIFKNQRKLKQGEKFLSQTASKLGVDIVRLKKDLASAPIQEKIDRDIAEAKSFNMQGTPGFLVNGVPIRGAYPAEHFEKIISKLQEKGKLKL